MEGVAMSPLRWLKWFVVALALVGVAGRVAAAEETRPNVLLIIPDQLRAQALGCMGNPDVRTPAIDQLAAEGLLFRQTFANSPVCCPARAILLTGKYAHKNGMVANDLRLRESEVTLAKLLKARGYQTGLIGKWHLDGGKRDPGFVPPGERRQGFDFWAACECRHDHFNPLWFRDTPEPIRSQKFEAEALTDVAVDFLRANRKQPFFLMLSLGPPHDPYGAPEPYMKLYDPQKLTMRPNWQAEVKQAGREQIAAYYAAVTAVDDQVGRLMRALKDLDLERDTIVLFTSDHGDMLGSQGARLKRKPWEESIRVPGILRYPAKVKAGRRVDTLLTHVDLAPTLLALCGVPVPEDMQGSDLAGVVRGETERGPDAAFFQIFVPFAGDETPHPWRGVRTQRHMVARTEAGPWVLYDLEKDPDELTNLANDPAAEGVRKELEARLAKWMKDTGDSWRFNSTVPVEDKGRLYRFETFYTIDEYVKWAAAHPDLAPKD
jgi:arylsulfatase A-like enzyme